jgi:hypothetical protein
VILKEKPKPEKACQRSPIQLPLRHRFRYDRKKSANSSFVPMRGMISMNSSKTVRPNMASMV